MTDGSSNVFEEVWQSLGDSCRDSQSNTYQQLSPLREAPATSGQLRQIDPLMFAGIIAEMRFGAWRKNRVRLLAVLKGAAPRSRGQD